MWRMSDSTPTFAKEFHSRRAFLTSAAALFVTVACASREPDGGDAVADAVGDPEPWTLFIGTYTKSGASRGIYQVAVEPETLAFGEVGVAAECADPSFLALTPDGRTLVVVNELLEYEGQSAGSVSAFHHEVRGRVHTLTSIAPSRSSRGAAPCYVAIDASGRYALVANYMGGNVATYPLAADGSLGEAVQVTAHDGTGPDSKRQEAPHAHCIVLAPDNRFAISADLGADALFVSAFNANTGKLTPATVPVVKLAPGAGPRHVAFSPDGRTLYCANELDSTLAVFAYDAKNGTLTPTATVSTRPAGAQGTNAPADLHVHPSGTAVYLSNRGDNTIAVFATDRNTGNVTLAQTIPSGGDWPRNFTLTPDATGLLVAHQKSDSVVAFRIDAATGQLTSTGQVLTTPVPVCLLFA